MQKAVTRGAQRLGSVTRSESPRIPFICASCRLAASEPSTPRLPHLPQRPFTTTARSLQQASAASTSPSEQPRSQPVPQTHYDFFPSTFPAGPPPHSPFTPDLRQLRTEFLQLQAKFHPDRAGAGAGAEKRRAEAMSARINEAYKCLQDPLKRAQYLLSLRGVDVEDESAKLEGKEGEAGLLMEVMEAREAVEEVENEEDLAGIREVNNGRIESSVGVLEGCFAGKGKGKGDADVDGAAREAVRLRYWMNIEESIHGWEKGKGGGVIHH